MAEISKSYIEHIGKQIGSENLSEFIRYSQLPLRKSIRVNLLIISLEQFFTRIESYNWKLQPIPWCNSGFWITRPSEEEHRLPLGNTLEHLAGLFYIQEASSMLPAEALIYASRQSSQMPLKILDMAASPGSKTTHLAALTNNQCLIIANEISASRVKSLYASLRRCGVSNYCLSHRDARDFNAITQNQFDAILLDAPCGGEGTVRKDPSALKNWRYTELYSLCSLQQQLIDSAYTALKPGGVLVYSTCTISREENHEVCNHLLQHTDCQIISLGKLFSEAGKATTDEGYLHVFPQIFDSEGFFVAAFRKPLKQAENDLIKEPFTAVKVSGNWQQIEPKSQAQFKQYLFTQFKFSLNTLVGTFLTKNIHNYQELWLFPNLLSNDLLQAIKPKRSGLRLAEVRSKNNQFQFRLTHEFIIAYGEHFSGNQFQVGKTESRDFLMGKDLQKGSANLLPGECIIFHEGFPLGLAKVINHRIKNNLPRELVKDQLNWAIIS